MCVCVHICYNLYRVQLLTQDEFYLICEKQLAPEVALRLGVKRQLADLLTQQEERREASGEILSEAAISTLDHVRRKADKKARQESIKVSVHIDKTYNNFIPST